MTQICQNCAKTEPRIYRHYGERLTFCCDSNKTIYVDENNVDVAIRYWRRYVNWHPMICKEVKL